MRLSQGIIPTDNIQSLPIDGYVAATDVVSNPISLKHVYGFSVTASWTTAGSPVGTFTLEACNDIENPTDYAPTYPTLTHWVTIAGSSLASSAGASISPSSDLCLTWNYSNTMYRFVRIRYARTSGTITLSERLQMKAGE